MGTEVEEYKQRFRNLLAQMREHGIELCFLITIGEYNGDKGTDYAPMRATQLELASELDDVRLVNDDLHTMRARGLMKDDFHYYQQAYNEVGKAAGEATARIVNAL